MSAKPEFLIIVKWYLDGLGSNRSIKIWYEKRLDQILRIHSGPQPNHQTGKVTLVDQHSAGFNFLAHWASWLSSYSYGHFLSFAFNPTIKLVPKISIYKSRSILKRSFLTRKVQSQFFLLESKTIEEMLWCSFYCAHFWFLSFQEKPGSFSSKSHYVSHENIVLFIRLSFQGHWHRQLKPWGDNSAFDLRDRSWTKIHTSRSTKELELAGAPGTETLKF